jgi:hypothetical protein
MKNILKYSISCLLLMNSVIINAQDRNVIWVHGILGGETSWQVYDDMFEQSHQMIGERMDYSDNHDDLKGFSIAATNLLGDINTAFPNGQATNPQNIAVCHSMGGLVTREMQRQLFNTNQADRFGGFITVGSPHNGAKIANSILNGSADAFTAFACTELGAGPNSTTLSFLGFTPNVICNIFDNQLFTPMKGAGNFLQSLKDMSPNSILNNQLNAHNANLTMPRLAITGRENGPVHWRVISSGLTSTVGGISNMNDEVIPNAISGLRNAYINMRTYNNILSSVYSILGGKGLFSYRKRAAFFANKAIQWNRGIVWFDNSENQWNTLTGCFQNTTTTITTQTYLAASCNQNYQTGTPAWQNCIIQQCGSLNMSNCWQTTTQTFTTIVRDRSDGVVCETSQGALGGTLTTIQTNGVNHFEERNTKFKSGILQSNDEIRDAFLSIWNRPSGDFFHIPLR